MWKDIINYEGLYKIDEYGNIFSLRSNRYLKPYISNKGYKLIDLNKNGKREKFTIHRLVAIHFVDNPNNYPIVLHLDNNKLNTYYLNLKWGSYSENNSQAINDKLNKIPIPDNRKYYEIYNENESRICCGIKEIININEYGNDSYIRNIISRKTTISYGKFQGYKIRKININRPIKFVNFR